MAISATHYCLLQKLRDRGAVLPGGSILEIGKANWYGDAPASYISVEAAAQSCPFEVARIIYRDLFAPFRIVSIDLDPEATDALRLDLNEATAGSGDLGAFDLTINHGTAEHIFNIANVFRLMHDVTKRGGLLIHESPFTGWIDHGFYSLQPTLFWDIAAANGYLMELVAIEHLASQSVIPIESRESILEMRRRDQLPDNAMLFVAMRKSRDEPFRIPIQGVYAGSVSESVAQAWKELR